MAGAGDTVAGSMVWAQRESEKFEVHLFLNVPVWLAGRSSQIAKVSKRKGGRVSV